MMHPKIPCTPTQSQKNETRFSAFQNLKIDLVSYTTFDKKYLLKNHERNGANHPPAQRGNQPTK